jgi:hypothetical protein
MTVLFYRFEGCDYWYIKTQTLALITRDEKRGGDYAHIARSNSEIFRSHDTATRKVGEPCGECGDPWPCSMVRGIAAPD